MITQMKHKGLIILAVLYFALLCILYIWNFPIYVLLAVGFIALLIVLIRQFYLLNIEHFHNKQQKSSFQLMENGTFRYYMDGKQSINGAYESHEDTVFFKGSDNTELPQFITLNIPAFQNSKFYGQITLHKNEKDHTGITYSINKLHIRKNR